MRWVLTVAATLAAVGIAATILAVRPGGRGNRPPPIAAAAPDGPGERIGEHFRLERPARLAEQEAEQVYRRLREAMRNAYRLSGLAAAADYQTWERHNRVPYRSATHGERYVNNYASPLARGYGRGGFMPVGAVLAKDAVTVTEDGRVYPGPLAVMEKMAPGFDPEGGDWRYALVMPDGSLLGPGSGADDGDVTFCRSCHLAAGPAHDRLFFVPETFRAVGR